MNKIKKKIPQMDDYLEYAEKIFNAIYSVSKKLITKNNLEK